MKYAIRHLMHKMSKKNEKESQGNDLMIMLYKDKWTNLSSCKDVKTCYYCDKLGHIVHFGYKIETSHMHCMNQGVKV